MFREHRRHRAAEERGVVARHRRDDQKLRLLALLPGSRLFEMDELAERALPDHALGDRYALSADDGFRNLPGRLAVAARRALEELRGGSHRSPEGGLGERIERALEIKLGGVRGGAEWTERSVIEFVELIVAQSLQAPDSPRRISPFAPQRTYGRVCRGRKSLLTIG